MALTVFETAEQQLLPCKQAVEQQPAGDAAATAGKQAVATAGAEQQAAAMLRETDRGGDGGDDDRPERDDIWSMIQAQKPLAAPAAPAAPPAAAKQAPYVRRSSSLLTQKSLEICTESLGSETGSDGFSDADGGSTGGGSCPGSDDEREEEEQQVLLAPRAAPPSRAFPPPLPSLARRKVEATMEMRQQRKDGRLLVNVVSVPSSTLFRAQRRGGRLLLSFADTAAPAADELDNSNNDGDDLGQLEPEQPADEHDAREEDEDEEEEEEEVEVVDRGTVVEFKVSTQPQAGSGSRPRVHRSALVINKFVGAEPAAATCDEINDAPAAPPRPPRRCTGSTTTAVAALAAASALSAGAAPAANGDGGAAVPGATFGENKLLMTAKHRRSKEELLKHMRGCSGQLRGPLFVWEGCITTST